MKNKRHNIIDDAWEMKPELMGGAEHTLRVGLVTNTVLSAMPIVIDDIEKLAVEKPEFDYPLCEKDLPVLLNFEGGDMQAAILVVYDKDSKHIQCYPFNNINDGGQWWLYEMAFDLVPGGFIEIRPVHPLLDEEQFEPTQGMMDHLEALATVVGSFLHRLQAEEISVVEDVVDYSKINKKRIKHKREPIQNDWKLVYAE